MPLSLMMLAGLGALVVVAALGYAFVRPGSGGLTDERRSYLLGKQAEKRTRLASVTELATDGLGKALEKRDFGLPGLLELAGIRLKASEFLIMAGAVALVAAAVSLWMGSVGLSVVMFIAVMVLARMGLSILIGRRRKKFANQLDTTLQMMASSLRAGYSLQKAVQAVGEEADSPTRDEFARVVNESRLGRPLGESLDSVSGRMKSEDFDWVGQAISINTEVGGNLAEVLDRVAKTIRERGQLDRQVAALAAEGKLSAIILSVLPVAISGFVSLTNPGYLQPMFSTPLGWAMLGACAVMLTLGVLWMRATVKIKY